MFYYVTKGYQLLIWLNLRYIPRISVFNILVEYVYAYFMHMYACLYYVQVKVHVDARPCVYIFIYIRKSNSMILFNMYWNMVSHLIPELTDSVSLASFLYQFCLCFPCPAIITKYAHTNDSYLYSGQTPVLTLRQQPLHTINCLFITYILLILMMYKIKINVHTLSQWKSNFLVDEYTEQSNFHCSDLMLMKTFFEKS